MSSKPYPEGVREVIATLASIKSLEDEINDLRRRTERLRSAEDAHELATRKLRTLMESMDLASSGNFGWEGRMQWFLGEMVRQAANGGRP